MRIAKLPIVLFVILFAAIHSNQTCFAAQESPQKPRWSVSNHRFELVHDGEQFFLRSLSPKGPQHIPVSKEWLSPPPEEGDEEDTPVVTPFLYDKQVTSFSIGNGEIGLHLSSYDIQMEGSLNAAIGRDVFLILNPATNTLREGIHDLGITKERVHSAGCFSASMLHFILSDENQDGSVDIGIIKEEIVCPEEGDIPGLPVYTQHWLHWYHFTKDGWKPEDEIDSWPDRYVDLPLIGISKGPVDFVAQLLWQTSDAAKWHSPPQFTPAYRKKFVTEEALRKPQRSAPHVEKPNQPPPSKTKPQPAASQGPAN